MKYRCLVSMKFSLVVTVASLVAMVSSQKISFLFDKILLRPERSSYPGLFWTEDEIDSLKYRVKDKTLPVYKLTSAKERVTLSVSCGSSVVSQTNSETFSLTDAEAIPLTDTDATPLTDTDATPLTDTDDTSQTDAQGTSFTDSATISACGATASTASYSCCDTLSSPDGSSSMATRELEIIQPEMVTGVLDDITYNVSTSAHGVQILHVGKCAEEGSSCSLGGECLQENRISWVLVDTGQFLPVEVPNHCVCIFT